MRRVERDLHDGAQARLVSLGMSLGMADELLDSDPYEAHRLLAESVPLPVTPWAICAPSSEESCRRSWPTGA